MNPTIILIGPLGAGKSTVGRLLAEKLGLPQCSLDDLRWGYFEELGYDKEIAIRIARSGKGIPEKLSYNKRFEVHAIERTLADHSHSVIDFGASNSVYEDESLLARVEAALAPYLNVILLLPSANPDESAEILRVRLTKIVKAKGEEIHDELFELNEYFIKQPSNRRLAKMIIYTKGKTPEEICDEILRMLVE
jgi:adenylate kinase family enzyme